MSLLCQVQVNENTGQELFSDSGIVGAKTSRVYISKMGNWGGEGAE